MTAISVIVPFRNAAATLGRCLEALAQQREPGGGYELIAVDNGSSDGSAEIARRHTGVRLLCEPRLGAYAARNCALRATTSALGAFTDADCVARPDWLAQLAAALEETSTLVAMGRDCPVPSSLAMRLLGEYSHQKDALAMSTQEPRAYSGRTNNLIARRELFAQVGLFDERPRGADVIFVRRVIALHGTRAVRYQPGAIVEHLEMDSLNAYLRKAFVYGGSARLYAALAPPPALRLLQRLALWSQTARAGALGSAEAFYLFALLGLGVGVYNLGWLATLRRPDA